MLSFLQKSPAKSVEVAKEFDETLDWKLQIFDIIKDIRDPEKPETLEELSVVQEDLVDVCESIEKPGSFTTHIQFVPTVPHCSLATLIGLCIRTKFDQELPKGLFKIDLAIKVRCHMRNNNSHYSKSQIFVQKFNFDKTLQFSREIKVGRN